MDELSDQGVRSLIMMPRDDDGLGGQNTMRRRAGPPVRPRSAWDRMG